MHQQPYSEQVAMEGQEYPGEPGDKGDGMEESAADNNQAMYE